MQKTKIGILSMHRIFNYGSFLQGYGLKQLIRNLSPEASIEFLDYRPGAPLIKSNDDNARGLARIGRKISEYGKVDAPIIDKMRFFNHKRTYARRYFPLLGLQPNPNYDYRVDLQVIGSDEVFNCVQANANVGYSRDLFGYASPAGRVISYAGSFGNTTLEKLERYGLVRELGEYFARFADISVRDENSRSIVEKLTGTSPVVNVDPVLAYDYMSECSQIPAARLNKRPYMIVYGYAGRLTTEENAAIREYAKAGGLEILCIGGIQGCCDRFVDCSPFDVLALFRDAEAIVTDTFHGSIFSIINKKKFLTIIRRSHGAGYGNEEKLRYLLDSMALSERGVYSVTADVLHELLPSHIDYGPTMSRLVTARQEAKAYLTRNLKLAEQRHA